MTPIKQRRWRFVRNCKLSDEVTIRAGTLVRSASGAQAVHMLGVMLQGAAQQGILFRQPFMAQAIVLPDGTVMPFDEDHWLVPVTQRRRP